MPEVMKGGGWALMAGGALLILINTILTPMLPVDQGEAVLRTSTVYLVRLSAAAVNALLLLFGCVALHLALRGAARVFGTVAFVVAFVGNSLFGIEWANVFVMRAVAQVSPDALPALDKSSLVNIGWASGASVFALGWLLMAITALRARFSPRWASIAVLAGLVLIPVLSATPLGMAGAIGGNVVLGLGLVRLGLSVSKAEQGTPRSRLQEE